MALLFLDGFDDLGTDLGTAPPPGLTMRYPENSNASYIYLDTGRFAARALELRFYSGSPAYVRHAFATPVSTLIAGFALKKEDSFANDETFFIIENASGSYAVELRLMSTGEIKVLWNGGAGSATTTTAALVANVWWYIEVKAVAGDSGSVELRVNGTTVLTQSSIDTYMGSNFGRVRLVGCGSRYHVFDDLYLCDGSGSANNDFLGPRHVETLYPTADTATVQWTTSTGTDHYALVDENPITSDTDYVQDSVAGNTDLFEYGSLARISAGINGVQIQSEVRCTDGTAQSLLLTAKSGTTQDDGSTIAVTETSYLAKQRVIEQDPNTTAAWTATGVNNAQFGLKVG